MPQIHEEATYTKMIEKKDGELQPGWEIDHAYHAWQAYTPWPGLFYTFRNIRTTLIEVEKGNTSNHNLGIWIIHENLPAIVLSG